MSIFSPKKKIKCDFSDRVYLMFQVSLRKENFQDIVRVALGGESLVTVSL